MSHLLYLHSFASDRFANVFGGGNEENVDLLLAKVHKNALKVSPAEARALAKKAVKHGLDGKPTRKEAQILLDAMVDVAITTKSFGIPTSPMSPMGAGGALFDAFESRFIGAGAIATKLFTVLQRGRNYEGGIILLSPDDVRTSAKLLSRIAKADDDHDEMDDAFREELVEPFEAAAKKSRAVFGHWG
jgi:hypothetical protein